MVMHSGLILILLSLTPFVASQTLQCDDIDAGACKIMEASKPDLCQDATLAHSACPRYCKLCPIECHHCNSTVLDYHECNTTMLCGSGEVCMIKELKSYFDGHHEYEMTCAPKQLCDGGSDLTIPFGKRSIGNRDISVTCCGTDLCNYPGPNTCPKDIIFLVDESSRLLQQDHVAVIRTIFGVANSLDIGMTDNLIAVYGYDTRVHQKFDLTSYPDKTDLLRHIQSANLLSRTNSFRADTDEAVKFLVDHAMSAQVGDRPSVPDTVVIIGDTITAQNTHVSLQNQAALSQKSNDVIVVSVGSQVISPTSSVEELATDSSHIIHVPNSYNFDVQLIPQLLQLIQQC